MIDNTHTKKIKQRLQRLYPKADQVALNRRIAFMVGRYGLGDESPGSGAKWSQQDAILITYADMVQADKQAPLYTLKNFANQHLQGSISHIHLLPFYPWSSDDGFSVIDFREVKEDYGDWADVQNLGKDFKLMFDLVLNHCSSESSWFKDFSAGIEPARHYFLDINPQTDLSQVVRPRTTPLLTPTSTRDGTAHVWTTFSADQVDLNWQNPEVLFEFLDILMGYISQGASVIRLDAVAFLWKKIGTDCIHRKQTHEVVKLIRNFLALVAPHVWIITETNVPHQENISYFGRGDEAHMVYNFTLPPLLLHALIQGNSEHLTTWAQGLSTPPKNTTYFNFTASHDGIGMRPLQGILSNEEIAKLADIMASKGGQVSSRTLPDGSTQPYELNITYYSALSCQDVSTSIKRFLCSQTIALSFQGVPGIYFHSLTATENDQEGVTQTGRARSINRKKWQNAELNQELAHTDSTTSLVFTEYLRRIQKRKDIPAFHPDAQQIIHNWGTALFVIERISLDQNQTVFALYNLQEQSIEVPQLAEHGNDWTDLLSGKTFALQEDSLQLQAYDCLWLVAK